MTAQRRSEQPAIWPLGLVFVLVLAVWIASGLMLHERDDRGTFGDMFGAVNSLFSGLAFAALVYTVLLQRRELQLQREELAETREEIKGQKLQLAAQNEVLRLQSFEQTFFSTLNLLNSIVENITTSTGENAAHGRDAIRRLYRNFASAASRDPLGPNIDAQIRQLSERYDVFYSDNGFRVGHYFRTLYNIIKLVENSPAVDKRFYTNIVRAQLSDNELALLFYNCLSNYGREKFKPFVERYSLLKNLDERLLLRPEHLNLYASGAYRSDA
jgi:hypothetical protein